MNVTRWVIMQKVRDQAYTMALSLFVSIRFQDLFHSPYRGSFHLSLTVLVHYRSIISILPWRVGPPDSDRITRVPSYSGYSPDFKHLRYETFTPYGTASQLFLLCLSSLCKSYNPSIANKAGLGVLWVRSPLLSESQLITLPAGT